MKMTIFTYLYGQENSEFESNVSKLLVQTHETGIESVTNLPPHQTKDLSQDDALVL